jgi:hypothetical protein
MLSKEQFVKRIKEIEDFNKEIRELEDHIGHIANSNSIVIDWGSKFMTNYMSLLGECVGDNKDDWIGWYCFENDFGEGELTVDDNLVDTPGKLYDIICSLSKEETL